jgi:uncharacterized protein YjbJ (UPF0337 family)
VKEAGNCNLQNVFPPALQIQTPAGRVGAGKCAESVESQAISSALSMGTQYAREISGYRRAGNRNINQNVIMNIFQVQGTWNLAKGRLKQKFAQLTDDDLQFTEGKEDELIGLIQQRTGQAKADIARAVGECCAIKPLNECDEGEKT